MMDEDLLKSFDSSKMSKNTNPKFRAIKNTTMKLSIKTK